MKPILSSLLIAVTFGPSTLFAVDTLPAAERSAKAAPPRYELKKRSSFEIAAGTRPPFWPIGWVKRAPGAPTGVPGAPKFILDPRNFSVTSILLGPPAIAVVNGRAYEEGQVLRMPRAAGPAVVAATPAVAGPRVRIHRIVDGQVWLQCDGQLVSVGLKRPELSERKVPDELLSSERDEDAPLPAASALPAVSAR